ncbi:hypothetical protein CFELI_01900 [Corynebacterium felinum]|uniref:Uncharacterized protein n=1 Tax=Corynebacterium felinum TaxID=131318 RepID=A0ABU2B9J5_9CORY|nr:hypothetical protein [Corynebacterium felinum]WJY94023.1 hypothetical protein CFELI_01900 [Corynebacterium felinum]
MLSLHSFVFVFTGYGFEFFKMTLSVLISAEVKTEKENVFLIRHDAARL